MIAYKFPILGRASDNGFLWPIAKGLTQENHKVTVIAARTPLGKSEVLRDGVRVHYIFESFPNLSHLKFEEAVLEKFKVLHSESPFHLVHSIDSSASLLAKHKDELNIKISYDVGATQMSQIFSILGMSQETVGSLLSTYFAVVYKFLTTYFGRDRELLSTADGVFVTSPQQRFFLERYYLYPDFHIYTVPYGVEVGDLNTKVETEGLRVKLGIPNNSHLVITMTDMTIEDEVLVLLRSFEKVAIKKPNTYMLIIGNGPCWKQIEYEIYNLALGSRVFLLGVLKPEEVIQYINLSDVFVNMSSRSTGFEPSMIEAMSQKKIIIGSELSPISHIIDDGVDGFLLRPADRESLSSLMIEIFSGTMPLEIIGERAQQKVLNLFDTRKMIGTLVESYKKILSRK